MAFLIAFGAWCLAFNLHGTLYSVAIFSSSTTKHPHRESLELESCGTSSARIAQLWVDEIQADKVLYPHRFTFDIVSFIDEDRWASSGVPSERGVPFRAGMNRIANKCLRLG